MRRKLPTLAQLFTLVCCRCAAPVPQAEVDRALRLLPAILNVSGVDAYLKRLASAKSELLQGVDGEHVPTVEARTS